MRFRATHAKGSEAFSVLICLVATKFGLFSVFTHLETICLNNWARPLLKNARNPLPVDVRLSKTCRLDSC